MFPLLLRKELPGGSFSYTFVSNFDSFRAGDIAESALVLVPDGISRVGPGFISSRFWRYNKPILQSLRGGWIGNFCYYFAPSPYYIEISDDGEFTEDSDIYFQGDDEEHSYFQYYLNKNVGRTLRSIVDSIEVGASPRMLPNLSQNISEYEQEIEKLKPVASALTDMWRK